MIRQSVTMTEQLKKELKEVSDATGLSETALINLATMSLIANWKKKGSFIFADLLNPEHRESFK